MTPGRATVPTEIAAAIRSGLPAVAEKTVAAIVVEVPSYADAFGGGRVAITTMAMTASPWISTCSR